MGLDQDPFGDLVLFSHLTFVKVGLCGLGPGPSGAVRNICFETDLHQSRVAWVPTQARMASRGIVDGTRLSSKRSVWLLAHADMADPSLFVLRAAFINTEQVGSWLRPTWRILK